MESYKTTIRQRRRRSRLSIFFRLFSGIIITAAMLLGIFYQVMRTQYPLRYEDIVNKYSQKYGVDKYLILAVIRTESKFDPNAQSEVGANGLMQLMQDTFEWVDLRMGDEGGEVYDRVTDPEVNIRYGTYLLKLLCEEYHDTATVLAAYHAGRGTVAKWLKDPKCTSNGRTLDSTPSAATNHYIDKVNHAYDIYQFFYGSSRMTPFIG